ncbi:MAG: DUF222 domain-containing protein [Leucobacter sp.]
MSTKQPITAAPEVLALDAVVERAIDAEREVRAAEVRMLDALADAFDLASIRSAVCVGGEDVSVENSTPLGDRAEMDYRAIRAELACALNLSETVIEKRMTHAWELRNCFAAALDAYREGEISELHAKVITEAGAIIGLGSDLDVMRRRGSYTEQVLEYAREMSPNRLRPIARRLAEEFAELTIDERHAEARIRRNVRVHDGDDGMVDLVAHLPAAQGYAMFDRMRQIARTISDNGEAAGRTRDEIMTDIFADMLLGSNPFEVGAFGDGSSSGSSIGRVHVRARVQILIPAHVLGSVFSNDPAGSHESAGASGPIGSTDPSERFTIIGNPTGPAPALFEGSGAIDGETAREIAADAECWDIIGTHPETAEVMSVDRYRPSESMRRLLRVRDQHCRFPGCRASLARCDIDHTVDAALGGPTSTDNLAHLCRGHHTLKHKSRWTVEQPGRGVLVWTAPSGRAYVDRPSSTVLFKPAVPDTAPGDLR